MRNLLTKATKRSRIRWVMPCCAIVLSLALLAQPLTAHAAEMAPGIYGIWLDWTVFESGNNGYGVVGGDGGASYGRYQFTVGYCLDDFINYCRTTNPEHFGILDANNLDATWQQAYAAYPDEFTLLQDIYALEYYYVTVRDGLEELYNIHLGDYSEVFRGTVFSIAIRNGRNVSLNDKTNHMRSVTSTYYEGIDEAEWLVAIYDAEADRHPKQDWRWREQQKAMALEALEALASS